MYVLSPLTLSLHAAPNLVFTPEPLHKPDRSSRRKAYLGNNLFKCAQPGTVLEAKKRQSQRVPEEEADESVSRSRAKMGNTASFECAIHNHTGEVRVAEHDGGPHCCG